MEILEITTFLGLICLYIFCLYIYCFIVEIKMKDKLWENEQEIKMKYHELEYKLKKLKQQLEEYKGDDK